jgi:dehydrogenase/reductase SDR family protein 12
MTFAMLKKIIAFYARFTASFTAIGFYARALFWPRFTPDFSGQTWIVTGATGGIGRAVVEEAVHRGAKVIAIARSAQKLADLKAIAPGSIITLEADLSLVRDSVNATQALLGMGIKFDVLVNNVGLLLDRIILTQEGKETSYATNLLNHFVLTEGLLRAKAFNARPTIINMASGGMYNAPLTLDYMNVQDPRTYRGAYAYAVHKRGQAALAQYWQAQHGAEGLMAYVMHPGWADTDGVKTAMPRFRRILQMILRTNAQGADTAIWLAAIRPALAHKDAFWFDRAARPAHAYPHTVQSKYTPDDLARFLDGEWRAVIG